MRLSEIKKIYAGGRVLRAILAQSVVWELPTVTQSRLFTTSGNFSVPEGCKKLTVTLIGGGGAAGINGYYQEWDGTFHATGGGGGSGAKLVKIFTAAQLAGNADLSIVIGAGGAVNGTSYTPGGSGGNTSVIYNGTTLTAGGGMGGSFGYKTSPNAGGVGGNGTYPEGFEGVTVTFGASGQPGGYRWGTPSAGGVGFELNKQTYGSGSTCYANNNGAITAGSAGAVLVEFEEYV